MGKSSHTPDWIHRLHSLAFACLHSRAPFPGVRPASRRFPRRQFYSPLLPVAVCPWRNWVLHSPRGCIQGGRRRRNWPEGPTAAAILAAVCFQGFDLALGRLTVVWNCRRFLLEQKHHFWHLACIHRTRSSQRRRLGLVGASLAGFSIGKQKMCC